MSTDRKDLPGAPAPAAATTASSAPGLNPWLERVMRGETAGPPIQLTLGGRIVAADAAAGTLESDYEGIAAFRNPAGQVQGGMLASMLDDVTALLVMATVAEGEHCATLNLNVSFLRPARPGPLRGRARIARRGRDVCHVHGELIQDGQVVASAVATCMVVRPRS